MSGTTSFAAIGTLPAKGGTTASLVTTGSTGWQTNSPLDTETLLDYFTEPYMLAHELSWPSFRYSYIFWIVAAFCCFVWAICHVMLRRKAGGALGASVRKVAMKRVQIGSTKSNSTRRFWVSPPLGYVALLLSFTVAIFCLSYVGPDYLAPTECTWGGVCPAAASASPPKTTFKSGSTRRQRDWVPEMPIARRAVTLSKRADLNPNGWAPCKSPFTYGSRLKGRR
jgi:hypothetical protein